MAKMFYKIDEAKTVLGKSEEEIKQLAKEGRLREFRDGTTTMYKVDQVEALKNELGSSSEPIELGLAADENSPLDLADSHTPGGSSAGGISLADSGGSRTGSKSGSRSGSRSGSGGAAPAPSPDDTAVAGDPALSSSGTGMPSPGRGAGSSHGSRSGIDIFQSGEIDAADSSAQTIASPGGSDANIESVGSGSGLLDLTRESDDTSLGAEVMDEIAPGASGIRRGAGDTGASATGTAMGLGSTRLSGIGQAPAPMMVEAPDPMAPALGWASLGAAAVLLFAAFALITGISGTRPEIIQKMGSGAEGGFSFIIVLAISFAVPIVLFAIGFLLGKMER